MKLEITQVERDLLDHAIDKAIASAARAQNTGMNPQIREVYAHAERELQKLKTKIGEAR